MKFRKILSILLLSLLTLSVTVYPSVNVANAKGGSVSVKGYTKSNGTYVAPYYRSAPDGNPYNNWSYPGNTNPYTGKTATGNPDTYLNNYCNNASLNNIYCYGLNSNNNSSANYYTPAPQTTLTLEQRCKQNFGQNSVAYGSDQCSCSVGAYFNSSKTSCVTLLDLCKEQFGGDAISYGTTQCTCPIYYKWSSDNSHCEYSTPTTPPLIGYTPKSDTNQYNFTSDLKSGMSGKDVTALQKFLIATGNLPPNTKLGTFGPATKKALVDYQSYQGLPATGIFDQKTRNIIKYQF